MTFTALHRALGWEPGPLTVDLLEAAVKAGVKESFDLDWKSQLPPLKGISQTDFPKDIAAMANSGGGLIVYGVCETQKAATSLTDVGRLDEGHERTLRSAAVTAITPPVFNLVVHRIGIGDGRYAVAVEVPASVDGPHLIYKGDYFAAPVRNDADTTWMKERQLETMYRARFDERRHANDALESLYREAGAGRDNHRRAWLIFVAHPRIPVLWPSLDVNSAQDILGRAWLSSQLLTGHAGTHPLDVVERHNPRPGLRRWVARYRPAGEEYWDEAWISVHQAGSITLAAAVGAHREPRTGGVNAGNEVDSAAVEAALADAMCLVRATADSTHSGEYDIRVGIEWQSDEPLILMTTDGFGRGRYTEGSIPIHSFTGVEVSLDAREPVAEFGEHVLDLARDCVNQGGVAALRLLKPSNWKIETNASLR